MLGIFRVHGLALIRRFLLAERDPSDLPGLSRSLPPCLPKFVARMQRCRCAFARADKHPLTKSEQDAILAQIRAAGDFWHERMIVLAETVRCGSADG